MKRISKDEEFRLIAAAQGGDSEAAGALLNAHRGFACKQAFYWSRRLRRMDYDDILQQCFMGMLRAIKRFDLSREFRFLTLAGWFIRHAINELERKNDVIVIPKNMSDRRGEVRVIELTKDHTEYNKQLHTRSVAEAALESGERVEWLRERLKRLPRRSQDVLLSHADGETLEEIAQRYGVTRECIRQIEKRAMNRIIA